MTGAGAGPIIGGMSGPSNPHFRKVFWLVLDSVGAGAMPDADRYGDAGANTLGNTARAVGGLRMPNLGRMGLGNLTDIAGVPPVAAPDAHFGRMAEASPGKDTTTYLDRVIGRITFAGAFFLSILALMQFLMPALLRIPAGAFSLYGGTSLLIVVGVALDTMRAIEAQLMMRNYEGFIK